MNKRTSIILVVVALGLLIVGTSIASAQATCPDPTNCPLGQQVGPMGQGRFGGQQNGMMGNGMMGQGQANGQQNSMMGRGRFGGQTNGQQNGQMGNGVGMMNGGPVNGQCAQLGDFSCLPAAVDGALSDDLVAAMTSGLLDEVNANAVYDGIIAQFGTLRPFVNIEAAESQHIAAWTFLFDRYGVELPAVTPTVDVPEFATVAEACQFAIDAEVGNAALYDGLLATFVDYPDITQVVTSLRDASDQNHLAALENCLAR